MYISLVHLHHIFCFVSMNECTGKRFLERNLCFAMRLVKCFDEESHMFLQYHLERIVQILILTNLS